LSRNVASAAPPRDTEDRERRQPSARQRLQQRIGRGADGVETQGDDRLAEEPRSPDEIANPVRRSDRVRAEVNAGPDASNAENRARPRAPDGPQRDEREQFSDEQANQKPRHPVERRPTAQVFAAHVGSLLPERHVAPDFADRPQRREQQSEESDRNQPSHRDLSNAASDVVGIPEEESRNDEEQGHVKRVDQAQLICRRGVVRRDPGLQVVPVEHQHDAQTLDDVYPVEPRRSACVTVQPRTGNFRKKRHWPTGRGHDIDWHVTSV
jgi:hypothetical protein